MPNATRTMRTYRALPLVLILACAPGVTDTNKTAAAISANTSPAGNAVVASVASPTPSVIVKNNGGHPVAGVDVTFTVSAGGGSVTNAHVLTDSKGVATVGSWTYGELVGANKLTASVDGLSAAKVDFNVTTKAGGPAALAKANDGQAAPVGEPLPQPVAVVVKDSHGNAIAGVSVAFATNSGSVNPTSALTDASGTAQTQWTMGSAPGAATMTATVPSLPPAAFGATATPLPAASVTKSNDGQSGTVGTALANPATVTVKDKFGNPVSGVIVQFAAGGNGSVSQASAMTDAQGVASTQWTLPTLAGAASLTATAGSLAPVSFSANAIAGAPAKIGLSGSYPSSATVFTVVGDSVRVIVRDSYDNAVANASVGFTAAGTLSSPSALTNASGVARVKWTLPKTAGAAALVASVGSFSATLNVTATPDVPASLTASGADQTGVVGKPLANPIGFTVKDQYGNLVANAPVKFTASGNGSAAPDSANSNAAGSVSTVWTLQTVAGAGSLGAVSGNASALIAATANPDAPASITKGNGDNQTANAGTTLPQSLVIVVRDQYGNPVPNTAVTYAPDAGSVSAPNTQTDPTGMASTTWTLGTTAGTQSVLATAGSASASFTATAIAVNNDPCSAKGTLVLNGAIAAGDITSSGCFYAPYKPTDTWSFSLSAAAGPVQLRYTADNGVYDTYMTLYRGQYTGQSGFLARNDDNQYFDATTNSGIRILGGAGNLVVGATTFYGTGSYQLAASSWDGSLDGCPDGGEVFAFAGANSTTSQTLAASDCTKGNTGRMAMNGRYADRVMVYLNAGETMTVTMLSSVFDAKLELDSFNAGWNLAAQDDNGAGGTDARLVFTAPASDFYLLYPTSVQDGITGAYTLTVSIPTGPSGVRSMSTSTTTVSRTALPASGTESRQIVDAYNSGIKK